MTVHRLGIIMHGITGRMGYNQHLVRSICAIRDQGGVALANGDRVMPDPILVGRNAEKVAAIARQHGIERSTADLDAALANQGRHRLLRRRLDPDARRSPREAIAAGKHVYCEKPVSETLAEGDLGGDSPRRTAASRAAWSRTSSTCPACARSACCATPASSAASSPCAASSATGCSRATGASRRSARAGTTARRTAAASSSTCSALALRARQPVRRRSRRCRASAPPTFPTRVDEQGKPYAADADDAAYATFQLAGGAIAHINSSWCVRVQPRRPRHLPGRRHARLGGRRPDPLLHPAPRQHAAPGVESGRAADHEVRAAMGGGAGQHAVRQRLQAAMGGVHPPRGRRTRRGRSTCSRAPRACSSPSSG